MNKIDVQFKDRSGILTKPKDLTGRFCRKPFELLEFHRFLDAYPCCPDWLPVSAGHVKDEEIMAVWNSESMQAIRQSIHDGSFKYCDQVYCPYIQNGDLPKKSELHDLREIIDNEKVVLKTPPKELALCYDLTCNLSCPSCRVNKISLTSGPEFDVKMAFTDKILKFIDQYSSDHRILLRVTGSGDPIASPIFLSLLKRLDADKHKQLRVSLQTNGTMLTEKIWNQLSRIHSLIDYILISIDAATEETYKIVRRGGSWKQLQKNLVFLTGLRKDKKLQGISFNFVAQNENFKEIPAFVEMAQHYKYVDQVFFSFVSDWKTWSPKEYEKQCVWKADHPNFPQLLEVLKSPVLEDRRVFLGNLADYRKMALNAQAQIPRQTPRSFFMKLIDRVGRRDQTL